VRRRSALVRSRAIRNGSPDDILQRIREAGTRANGCISALLRIAYFAHRGETSAARPAGTVLEASSRWQVKVH
jgi:hypothetical protein